MASNYSNNIKDWEERLIKDLKGSLKPEELIGFTEDDLAIKPLYTEADLPEASLLEALNARFNAGKPGLKYIQRVNTVAEALSAIEAGAGGVSVNLDDISEAELKQLIHKVDIRKYALMIQNGDENELSSDFINQRITAKESVEILNFLPYPTTDFKSYTARLQEIDCAGGLSKKFKALSIPAHIFYEAGATSCLELALALTWLNENVKHLEVKPEALEILLKKSCVSLAVGVEFIESICKLRAMEWLWMRFIQAYGVNVPKLSTLAIATERYSSSQDPNSNLLRNAIATLSAFGGNADYLMLPKHSTEDNNAARLATNTALLAEYESAIGKFNNAWGGSYTIEAITWAMAEKAWDLFKEIEAEGGFIAALKSAWVSNKINAANSARLEKYKAGKVLVGVNKFSNQFGGTYNLPAKNYGMFKAFVVAEQLT